jgi:Fe-S-cluster-containing dehydrogenase component
MEAAEDAFFKSPAFPRWVLGPNRFSMPCFGRWQAGAGYRKGRDALTAKHWAMVIDTRKLQTAEDLEPIIEACNKIHNIPTAIENKNHEIKWIWETHTTTPFPDKTNNFLNEEVEHSPFLVLCNHCENPPCVRPAPPRRPSSGSDGIVLMDFHRCIGCRFCMAACPFGARSFNFRDPRPFIEENNKAVPHPHEGCG